jgi:hypothetical protein
MVFFGLLTFGVASWGIFYALKYLIGYLIRTGEFKKPLPAKRKLVVDPNFIRHELYIEILVKKIFAFLKVQWETPQVIAIRKEVVKYSIIIWNIIVKYYIVARDFVVPRIIALWNIIRDWYQRLMAKPIVKAVIQKAWTGSQNIRPLIRRLANYIENSSKSVKK